MIKRNIEQIKKAQREGRLTIFVGAGVSRSSDPTAPDLLDLVNSLQSDLGTKDESDYLKIAQLYHNEFGEYALYEKLKILISSDLEPSLIHELIFKINPQYIITTNWDTILEKEMVNSLSFYEKIVSDKDLSKSLASKKLIKMHGDFANHNIVFKEDDYLKYEQNFPLINNYIKGILTTNTVVFIGYSYNDINLKRIMSWIKIRSDSTPPMFMLQTSENKAQIKYLENHGISTILLPKKVTPQFPDERSGGLYYFLESIVNQHAFNEAEVSPLEAIYNKLCQFNGVEYILQSQICFALGNCDYRYIGSQTFLIFHDQILSGDLDPSERSLNNLFVEKIKDFEEKKLSSRDGQKLLRIFDILKKANISGIRVGVEKEETYFVFDDLPEFPASILDKFCFANNYAEGIGSSANAASYAALRLTEVDDMSSAMEILENAIQIAISKRRIVDVLILSKNHQHLSYLIAKEKLEENTSLKNIKSKFSDPRSYFDGLSLEQRDNHKLLMESLERSFVKSLIFYPLSELNKQKEHFDTVMNKGVVYNRHSPGISAKHKNILFYFVGNGLFDAFNSEFSQLNKTFLEASFIHKIVQRKEVNLEKHEVYALANFYKSKELISFLGQIFLSDGKVRYPLKIADVDSNWIIDVVIENLIDGREKAKSVGHLEKLLGNIFYILSFTHLSDVQHAKGISALIKLIRQGRSSILTYEMLNSFITNQYVFYGTSPEPNGLESIFDTIFKKFINETANGYDSIAVGRNYIGNIYKVAKSKGLKLRKSKSLDLLIVSLEGSNIEYQYEFSSGVLLSIYTISDKPLEGLLKDYFQKLKNKVKSNLGMPSLYFNLCMIANGIFKNEPSDVELFKEFFINNSELAYHNVVEFEGLVNFLAKEKRIKKYQEIYESIFSKSKNKINRIN